MYDDFLLPNDLVDDQIYFTRRYMIDLLRVLGVDQGNAIADHLEEFYFRPDQLGSLEKMTAGLVDFEGAFFIKASAYHMIEENSKHARSFYYSVDHASRKSLYYVLNMRDKPPYTQENGMPGLGLINL